MKRLNDNIDRKLWRRKRYQISAARMAKAKPIGQLAAYGSWLSGNMKESWQLQAYLAAAENGW